MILLRLQRFIALMSVCVVANAAEHSADLKARTVVSEAGLTQYLVGFAHVAYGFWNTDRTGYWKTTFVFRNDSATAATVTLRFFADDGQPLNAPILSGQRVSQQDISVPSGGAAEIVLDPMNDALTQGWVAVEYTNIGIKGQGIFTQHLPDGKEDEAVVSMVSQTSASCIIPLPGSTAFSMPFDNTNGRVSSYAFANTTSATVVLRANFFGPSGEALGEITHDVPGFGHTAFATTDRLASLAGQKGTMRIDGNGIIPLGFRFNRNSFTTWLER